MLKCLTIDGLIYEVRTDNHNCLYVALVGGSNKAFNPVQYDPFDRYEQWADEPYRTEDINAIQKPILVQRQVLRCIHAWLREKKPYYFRYQISSERRLRLYSRVALRLASQHDYTVQSDDRGCFHFYKNTAQHDQQCVTEVAALV